MRDSKRDIIAFWFDEIEPRQWFQVSSDFDKEIIDRFLVTFDMACEGLCDQWQDDAEGSLALCLVYDQFPRNMFRGTPRAFETDEKAKYVAKHSIAQGFDVVLPVNKRRFLYMPYMHSENIEDQSLCVELFSKIKDEDQMGYDYAVRHKDVIEKFSRFPHRNSILGRESSSLEQEYLAQPGSGF